MDFDYTAERHRRAKYFQRAEDNLTYLEFIALVRKLWDDSHPDIPLLPSGSGQLTKYPVLVYGLELRKTLQNEPKPRYREELEDIDGQRYIIRGQRFHNVISFAAIDEQGQQGAETAEALIEAFEDFMMEFTSVFKRLGASDLVYGRRMPDFESSRVGQGTVSRTVAYMVTLEKIIKTPYSKIEQAEIDARRYLQSNENLTLKYLYGSATPPLDQYDQDVSQQIVDQTIYYESATPSIE